MGWWHPMGVLQLVTAPVDTNPSDATAFAPLFLHLITDLSARSTCTLSLPSKFGPLRAKLDQLQQMGPAYGISVPPIQAYV